MTRLRWAEPASRDFLGIVEWIKARNPPAAAKVGRHILDSVEGLARASDYSFHDCHRQTHPSPPSILPGSSLN